MNSRRSSTDELEATALFADHDVEEPIEILAQRVGLKPSEQP